LITPGWCFHDHGNETAEPSIWLDGLDLPLVGFLGAGFGRLCDKRCKPSLVRPAVATLALPIICCR
jgi:gentisate 1,2-dioxygenase